MTAFNDKESQSVEPNGQQLEHESLRNLDASRRHEPTEKIAFHEQMERNANTKDQNSAVGQAAEEMPKGFSANQTTHAKRRSLGNRLRTSLLHLKNWSGWYNRRLNDGKVKFKEIGRWFYGKSLQDVDENDIIARIGYCMRKN